MKLKNVLTAGWNIPISLCRSHCVPSCTGTAQNIVGLRSVRISCSGRRPTPWPAAVHRKFAPLVLRQDLCGARIVGSDGRVRPLVTDSTVLVPSRAVPLQQGFPLSPIACAVVLLLAAVALSLFEWRRGKVCWPFDATLMLLHGAAGVVVTFMFFFSTHPTVGSNWLILLLNPVPLLFIYPMMKRERRMAHSPVHMAFAVWTGLFLLLAPLMPQKFPAALCVLALILLYRSAGYVLLIRKTDNTKRNKSLKIKTHD